MDCSTIAANRIVQSAFCKFLKLLVLRLPPERKHEFGNRGDEHGLYGFLREHGDRTGTFPFAFYRGSRDVAERFSGAIDIMNYSSYHSIVYDGPKPTDPSTKVRLGIKIPTSDLVNYTAGYIVGTPHGGGTLIADNIVMPQGVANDLLCVDDNVSTWDQQDWALANLAQRL